MDWDAIGISDVCPEQKKLMQPSADFTMLDKARQRPVGRPGCYPFKDSWKVLNRRRGDACYRMTFCNMQSFCNVHCFASGLESSCYL